LNTLNDKNTPWYKEHYVWMIIFFPLLAVVGGVITTYLAVESNDGLVVDDYYKEGLEINRTLERDQIALDYQLQAEILFHEDIEEVVVKLSADTNFSYPENISISFLHSTVAGLDRKVNTLLTNGNVYRGHLSKLDRGKWYVYIQHDDWRLINTVIIK
jgi:uncharacterized protein